LTGTSTSPLVTFTRTTAPPPSRRYGAKPGRWRGRPCRTRTAILSRPARLAWWHITVDFRDPVRGLAGELQGLGRLTAFLVGDLDSAAARRWDEHLLECERCWRAVREDRDGRRAAGCPGHVRWGPGPLSSHDLVHGNFNLANTIAAPGRLWVVGVEALGAGPRAYDLAEALLVAAGSGHLTGSAAARLWAYGAGLDRREFAICAGSVGLTMADAFIRHRRLDLAAGAVPGMVRTLGQVLALAGA